MIKKNLRLLIITSIVILLPILLGVLLWDKLPARIETHWNFKGEVDGYSSKTWVVFGMPLLLLFIHWICTFATLCDPKKHNHSDKILKVVLWIVPLLSVLMSAITFVSAMGKEISVNKVAFTFMGVLFVIIGNYLPKCKQNYTVGIKIAWTLNSEENWNKTHRFAGRIWVIFGILIALLGLFDAAWLVLISAFIMVLAPIVYSYVLYRKGI